MMRKLLKALVNFLVGVPRSEDKALSQEESKINHNSALHDCSIEEMFPSGERDGGISLNRGQKNPTVPRRINNATKPARVHSARPINRVKEAMHETVSASSVIPQETKANTKSGNESYTWPKETPWFAREPEPKPVVARNRIQQDRRKQIDSKEPVARNRVEGKANLTYPRFDTEKKGKPKQSENRRESAGQSLTAAGSGANLKERSSSDSDKPAPLNRPAPLKGMMESLRQGKESARIDFRSLPDRGVKEAIESSQDNQANIIQARISVSKPKSPEPARKTKKPSVTKCKTAKSTLIIGFDYGTHSTKVVVRKRGSDNTDAKIIAFDQKRSGYPSTASPSLVRFDDGALYFGTEALRRKTGKLYRSLKVNLLPASSGSLPSSHFPRKLNAKKMVAAYLAWAFQQTKLRLGKDKTAKIFLNVSIPMAYCGSKDPKKKRLRLNYLKIVQAAWKLAFVEETYQEFTQGMHIDDVNRILGPLLKERLEPETMRRFNVMPETIAPLVSVSLNPLSQPGLYMVVDMGAATTEVSVFHLGERGIDQKILCYQDSSWTVGGNDLWATEFSQSLDKVVGSLKSQIQSTWFNGFQMDMHNRTARKRWKQFQVMLSGGGTLVPEIQGFLEEFNPKQTWESSGNLKGLVSTIRHVPNYLDSRRTIDDQNRSLYAVANGLAVDVARWPDIHDDISPLEPPDDEPKPEGYWYLDD